MKKIIIKIFIFLIVMNIFPISIFALENEEYANITPNAYSTILIEASTGKILYNKNANEKHAVASLTKMMGLILIFEALENDSLKLDEMVTTSRNAKEMGGSQIWLEEGEKISVNDLIKGITMASANDAMVLMAERLAGTEEAFVKLMNKKAKELGLKNTNFKNSTGLDEEGAYSSAYDMAIIAKNLLKHSKILDYTSVYEDYIRENTDNKTWIVNTNKLVRFYDGADGLKTGNDDEAGRCIAVTAKKDNLRLIMVSLGYKESVDRNNEAMNLLDYGFNLYEANLLYKKGDIVGKTKLDKATINEVELVLEEDILIVKKKSEENKTYDYKIKINELTYPINKNDIIGKLEVREGNNLIKEVNLLSKEEIKKMNIIKLYFNTLIDTLTGV